MTSAVQSFLSELARRDPAQAVPDPSAELELEFRSVQDEALPAYARGGPFAGYTETRPGWEAFDQVRERVASGTAPTLPSLASARDFRYLGSALGPFLVFEREGALWFLDQHAAHERLIFDALQARPRESQELLVPERIECEDESEAARVEAALPRLAEAGFRLEREGLSWVVAAAPPELSNGAAAAVMELASGAAAPLGASDPRRAARALAACRAAVKDGERLDDAAAEELIARALELPEPRCPHGRPIWTRITREQLYRLVRREV